MPSGASFTPQRERCLANHSFVIGKSHAIHCHSNVLKEVSRGENIVYSVHSAMSTRRKGKVSLIWVAGSPKVYNPYLRSPTLEGLRGKFLIGHLMTLFLSKELFHAALKSPATTNLKSWNSNRSSVSWGKKSASKGVGA